MSAGASCSVLTFFAHIRGRYGLSGCGSNGKRTTSIRRLRYAGQSTHSWPGKACFFGKHREEGGPGFAGGGLGLIDLSGCWRKNWQKFLEDSEFVWQGILQGVVGPPDTTNRELSKTLQPNVATGQHQYRLQIAEGMVTFLESYERELEKYWRKTLFFQLKQRIRSLPDSSDAHKGRRHQT